MKHLPALLFTAALLALDWFFIQRVLLADPPNADLKSRIIIGVLLALVTVLVVSCLVHFLAAAFKGSLKMRFINRPYTWDEEIAGSVDLSLHRRLVVERLTVTLLAQRRVSGGQNDNATWHKVIQIDQDLLAGGETLLPGKHAYAFKVRIPAKPPGANDGIGSALLEGLGKGLSSMVKFAVSTAQGGELDWKIQAQLHTAGADLSDERALRFNRGQF